MLVLRPYQDQAKKDVGVLLRKGYTKIVVTLPTGAGKTALFIDMANRLFLANKKVLIVMRRRSLIFQTAKKFKEFTGHMPSILMGNEKGFDPNNNVQVMSIDTVARRIDKPGYEFLLDYDYAFVDEMHDTTAPKYFNFLNRVENMVWIGLSATVMPTGKKYLGDIGWQEVIKTIESSELRDDGYLVKDVVYAPKKIDTSGIKTTRGDFDNKTLAERASSSVVIGDTVETWKKYGDNRPTLLFAVNKEHSRVMAEGFRQAGIGAIAQDESHNTEERDNAIKSLENGDIKILCSVNIFSTGTDIPKASCLIMARPTKSEILFVQQIGRGLRPYKKCARCKNDCGAETECFRCGCDQFTDIKDDCIILDHANNCERFGMAYDKREPKLTRPTEKKKSLDPVEDMPKTKTCSACFAVYEFNELACPLCGHTNEIKKRMIEHEEGELKRVTSDGLNVARFKKTLDKYLAKELRYNLKPNFKYFKLHEDHGDAIFEYTKQLGLPSWLKGIIQKQKLKDLLESTKKL